MNDIPEGQTWLGTPARPAAQSKRQMIAIQHLPELLRRMSELERKLGKKKD
jgi:UDP-3-O-[3-hydroxymyristoyl] glucosamine N-acyltransferase